jgi:hypothetical protein
MNKQEVIDEIENAIPDFILNDFQRGKETGLTDALELVEELDEPEKVVVSKLEAEWLDKLKAYYRHREDRLYVITRQGWGNDFCFSCHGEQIELSYEPYKGKEDIESVKRRLVNAILYGYEVEKEKLYTVKFSNEDFGKFYIGIFKAVNKFGISSLPLNDDDVKSWFTEDELERFKFWNNPAFEIKEVTE